MARPPRPGRHREVGRTGRRGARRGPRGPRAGRGVGGRPRGGRAEARPVRAVDGLPRRARRDLRRPRRPLRAPVAGRHRPGEGSDSAAGGGDDRGGPRRPVLQGRTARGHPGRGRPRLLEGRREGAHPGRRPAEQVVDIAGQELMTADKVTPRLNAVVTFKVADPLKAVTIVDDYRQALYRQAQLALRGTIGTRELDTLLTDKDAVARDMDGVARARVAP